MIERENITLITNSTKECKCRRKLPTVPRLFLDGIVSVRMEIRQLGGEEILEREQAYYHKRKRRESKKETKERDVRKVDRNYRGARKSDEECCEKTKEEKTKKNKMQKRTRSSEEEQDAEENKIK